MSQQLELLTESPSQWTTVSYVTPEIQKKEIKPFVILALKELESTPDSRTSNLVNVDKFAAVRAVVRHLARLRSACKEPWRQGDVAAFLEGLKFSPECTAELSALLCKEQMYASVPTHLRVKRAVTELHWRIDLSLCQASIAPDTSVPGRTELLQRGARVLLTLRLSDGARCALRLPVARFHELRFAVASALKTMIVLEKRKCMRKD